MNNLLALAPVEKVFSFIFNNLLASFGTSAGVAIMTRTHR
jgi:hypothetical protein